MADGRAEALGGGDVEGRVGLDDRTFGRGLAELVEHGVVGVEAPEGLDEAVVEGVRHRRRVVVPVLAVGSTDQVAALAGPGAHLHVDQLVEQRARAVGPDQGTVGVEVDGVGPREPTAPHGIPGAHDQHPRRQDPYVVDTVVYTPLGGVAQEIDDHCIGVELLAESDCAQPDKVVEIPCEFGCMDGACCTEDQCCLPGSVWAEVEPGFSSGKLLTRVHVVSDELFYVAQRDSLWAAPASTTLYRGMGSPPVMEVAFAALIPALLSAPTEIWSDGPDDVYVSLGSEIRHYDGGSWAVADTMSLTPADDPFVSVWGTGPADVYSLTRYGSVRHYQNGVAVPDADQEIPVPGIYHEMHGTGPGDIWFVGEPYLLVHYDGETYTETAAPAGTWAQFGAVWAKAPDDVYVGGATQTGTFDDTSPLLLHYHGVAWNELVVAWTPKPAGPGLLTYTDSAVVSLWGGVEAGLSAASGMSDHVFSYTTATEPFQSSPVPGEYFGTDDDGVLFNVGGLRSLHGSGTRVMAASVGVLAERICP